MHKRTAMVVAVGLAAASILGGIALAAAGTSGRAPQVGTSVRGHADHLSGHTGLDSGSTAPNPSQSTEPDLTSDHSMDDPTSDHSYPDDPYSDDSMDDSMHGSTDHPSDHSDEHSDEHMDDDSNHS